MRRLVYLRKHVLIVGALVLLLAVLVAVGVTLVVTQAHREQQQSLTVALEDAQHAASTLALAIRLAFTSAQLAIPYIQRNPGPGGPLLPSLPAYMDDWMALAPCPGSVISIVMNYQGRPVVWHPPPSPEVQKQLPTLNALLPVGAAVRNQVIYGMRNGVSALSQSRTRTNTSESLFLIRVPVFVNATSAAETWGWPANASADECASGALPCFNATSGRKWWGLVSITLGRQQMIQCDMVKTALVEPGYGYTVSVSQDAPGLDSPFVNPTQLLTNLGDHQQCASPSVESVEEFGPGLQLHVEMCLTSGWTVVWVAPLLVLVVVLSIGIVVASAFAISTWVRHSELVHALLPAPAIHHLMTNMPQLNEHKVLPGSPAEKMASLLGQLLRGEWPPIPTVVHLMAVIKQQVDLYLPEDLQAHVLQAAGMDEEVAAALMATVLPDPAVRRRAARSSIDANSATYHDLNDVIGAGAGSVAPEMVEFSDLADALCSIMGLETQRFAIPTAPTDATDSTTPYQSAPLTPFSLAFLNPPNTPVVGEGENSNSRGKSYSLAFSMVDANEELCVQHQSVFSSLHKHQAAGHVHTVLLTRLEQVLLGASSLSGDFDAFELHEASNGHPLAVLGMWVFSRSGLLQDFKLCTSELVSFLQAIESGYSRGNGYHNSTHAADVLQSVHAMLGDGGVRGTYADGCTTIALYLAAIIHDYEHRGRTNDFLINTGDELAVRYNDRSPQENHHVSAAFHRLNQKEHNFLRHLPSAQRLHLRKLTIDLVLATDMKQHFALCGLFTSVHRLQPGRAVERATKACQPRPALHLSISKRSSRRGSIDRLTQPRPSSHTVMITGGDLMQSGDCPAAPFDPIASGGDVASVGPPSTQGKASAAGLSGAHASNRQSTDHPLPLDDAERLLSLQIMLKVCDLGHTCASLPVHLKWVKALESEMFAQGDAERALGLPISPLCDRQQIGITKSQVGFFDVVVLPLLAAYTSRFPASKSILNSAASNYHHWRACAENNNAPR